MENKHVNAKVLVMRRVSRIAERSTGNPCNKEEVIEIDVHVAKLNTDKYWRRNLRKVFIEKGEKVEAINPLAQEQDGCQVVVVLAPKTEGIQRRKPITRGGRPIEGPIRVAGLKQGKAR